MDTFGDNISKLRKERNLSQRGLADALGVSKSTVAKWESSNTIPDFDGLDKIGDFFGVRVGALFMDDFDPSILSPWINANVLGSIAAGTPIEMIKAESMFPVPAQIMRNHKEAFYLKVKGNSMDKVLPNGSYALIDPSKTDPIINNHAYAVCVNGHDATIKRIHKLNNGFELVPDSNDPTYKPTIYDYGVEGTETITVIGEVVWYTIPFDFEI